VPRPLLNKLIVINKIIFIKDYIYKKIIFLSKFTLHLDRGYFCNFDPSLNEFGKYDNFY